MMTNEAAFQDMTALNECSELSVVTYVFYMDKNTEHRTQKLVYQAYLGGKLGQLYIKVNYFQTLMVEWTSASEFIYNVIVTWAVTAYC